MFAAQIMRRSSLVTELARALNLKTTMPYQPKSMPPSVERRAYEIGLDIIEVQSRHKVSLIVLYIMLTRTNPMAFPETRWRGRRSLPTCSIRPSRPDRNASCT